MKRSFSIAVVEGIWWEICFAKIIYINTSSKLNREIELHYKNQSKKNKLSQKATMPTGQQILRNGTILKYRRVCYKETD